MTPAMRVSSWIIREIVSKRVICETFNGAIRNTLNSEKYEMVPITEYLASLNTKDSSHEDEP
jgi:hypothetical protein